MMRKVSFLTIFILMLVAAVSVDGATNIKSSLRTFGDVISSHQPAEQPAIKESNIFKFASRFKSGIEACTSGGSSSDTPSKYLSIPTLFELNQEAQKSKVNYSNISLGVFYTVTEDSLPRAPPVF